MSSVSMMGMRSSNARVQRTGRLLLHGMPALRAVFAEIDSNRNAVIDPPEALQFVLQENGEDSEHVFCSSDEE
jgi:hypothetical protein